MMQQALRAISSAGYLFFGGQKQIDELLSQHAAHSGYIDPNGQLKNNALSEQCFPSV